MAASEEGKKVERRTKEFAQRIEKELKALNSDLGPKFWKMAELITTVHDKVTWQILGHESAQKYREELLISRSSWFEKRRIWTEWAAIALDKELITRARLDRMPSQNVKQLLRLDERRRFDPKWIEKALNLKEAELEAQVDHVVVKNTEAGMNEPEAGAIIKWKTTATTKKAIVETIHDFAVRQNLPTDNEPQTLIFMLMDYRAGWPESGAVVAEDAAAAGSN